MVALKKSDFLPDVGRDANLMSEILDQQVAIYRNMIPPPNEELFNATVKELRKTTSIFLQEEAVLCQSSGPFCFEAAIGLEQDRGSNTSGHPGPGCDQRGEGTVDQDSRAHRSY